MMLAANSRQEPPPRDAGVHKRPPWLTAELLKLKDDDVLTFCKERSQISFEQTAVDIIRRNQYFK